MLDVRINEGLCCWYPSPSPHFIYFVTDDDILPIMSDPPTSPETGEKRDMFDFAARGQLDICEMTIDRTFLIESCFEVVFFLVGRIFEFFRRRGKEWKEGYVNITVINRRSIHSLVSILIGYGTTKFKIITHQRPTTAATTKLVHVLAGTK